jgi:hypothetical protein
VRHDIVLHAPTTPPQNSGEGIKLGIIARFVVTVGLSSFTMSTVFNTPLPITSVILASAYGAGVAVERIKLGEGQNPSKLVQHTPENTLGNPPSPGFSALPASQLSTYGGGVDSQFPKSRGTLEVEPMRPENRATLFEEM